jgi:hypothetical protein
MVLIHGVMDTIYEERCIVPISIQTMGLVAPIKPVYVNLRDLGGGGFGSPPLGQRGVDGGIGLNNIGVLMKSSGEVTWTNGSTLFYMTVGGRFGTYVSVNSQAQCPSVGDICSVTGVSAMGYNPGDGKYYRLLMTRYASDIKVEQQ